jgi:hypothetical protein
MRIDYICRLFVGSRSLEHPVFGLESLCCLKFRFDKDSSIVRYVEFLNCERYVKPILFKAMGGVSLAG